MYTNALQAQILCGGCRAETVKARAEGLPCFALPARGPLSGTSKRAARPI